MSVIRHVFVFLFFPTYFTCTLAENPSVVIIGAGPAGLAAATTLLENSITNVTLLEAEDRIGGRINSVNFGKSFVDLGAEYCHGEKGNVVFDLAKNLDVLEHSNLFKPENVKFFSSDGHRIPSDIQEDLETILDSYDEDLAVTDNNTLKDGFLAKYKSTIIEKYKNDEKKLQLASDAIHMLHSMILMHEGAFDWSRPSAKRKYEVCEGDQAMTWKIHGYHVALEIMMKSYPNASAKLPIDDKIIFNKKVNKVVWKESKVTVKTKNNLSLTADHVIFTPSIGVLKHQKDTLFDPQLPPQKQLALNAIGFDGIMKIFLYFPDKWWRDDDTAFIFVWESEDLLKIRDEFPDGPSKDGHSWVSYVPSIVSVASNPNVLLAWVSGELVPELEKSPDELLQKGCMYLINKFLAKKYNITNPEKMLKSQWVTNSNFLGTYSYENAGYFREDISYQKLLAEPLVNDDGHPTVLFAGEATHPVHYSTVHGAIETGRREAQRIINMYK